MISAWLAEAASVTYEGNTKSADKVKANGVRSYLHKYSNEKRDYEYKQKTDLHIITNIYPILQNLHTVTKIFPLSQKSTHYHKDLYTIKDLHYHKIFRLYHRSVTTIFILSERSPLFQKSFRLLSIKQALLIREAFKRKTGNILVFHQYWGGGGEYPPTNICPFFPEEKTFIA